MPWCETIGDRSIRGGQGPVDPTADIDFASLGSSAIDEHRPQVVYATLTAVSRVYPDIVARRQHLRTQTVRSLSRPTRVRDIDVFDGVSGVIDHPDIPVFTCLCGRHHGDERHEQQNHQTAEFFHVEIPFVAYE